MIGFLRFLAVLLLVRFGLRFLAAAIQPPAPAAEPPRASGSELVRDRVCNTFIPRERALLVVVNGHEQHFCSPACRDRALALAS